MENAQPQVQPGGRQPGQRARQRGGQGRQPGIHGVDDQRRCHRRAQRKAAVGSVPDMDFIPKPQIHIG